MRGSASTRTAGIASLEVDSSVGRGEGVGPPGKPTLVKAVMGYHQPDPGGMIVFEDERIGAWSPSPVPFAG